MNPSHRPFRTLLSALILASLFLSTLSTAQAQDPLPSPNGETPGTKMFLPLVTKPDISSLPSQAGWPMAGANAARTSWTAAEVSGMVRPVWFKKFEPYISPKVQIIALYDTLYVATAKGLYAIDAATGAEKWVYPTELPLGNSPTVDQGVAYVGGYDHKLHAIDAYSGAALWQFEAGAGFDTNPLLVNNLVMAGNRDGNFYAVYRSGPNAGREAWRFHTNGPIDYSAAYGSGVVYFASEDSYAYALDADTGNLVWKSAKLPGAGFESWWPVVYNDWVIFSGSANYREGIQPGEPGDGTSDLLTTTELREVFPNYFSNPRGTLVGPLGNAAGSWVPGTPTMDLSRSEGGSKPVTKYFEEKPYRRTMLVLNRANGAEYTTDFDKNGKPEYAPFLWLGTHSGNRYPPVVGSDGVLYQNTMYLSDQWIAGGQIVGWKPGSPVVSIVSSDWNAVDEPQAFAAGGNHIYWNLCCDRESGSFDITKPNTLFQSRYQSGTRPATDAFDISREVKYFEYNLEKLIPGYNSLYYNGTVSGVYSAFGGRNGVYGYHGLQNPPIPYKGRLYMHRSNTLIAFGSDGGPAAELPLARIVSAPAPSLQTPTVDQLKQRLADEVTKMIQAGHLRPGYFSTGLLDIHASRYCGDDLLDYWHFPGDTTIALSQALPYLSQPLQDQAKAYLQSEFQRYPPYQYNHIGWKDGAAREPYIVPNEAAASMSTVGAWPTNWEYGGWDRNPLSMYATWKYAQLYPSQALTLFNASKGQLEAPPSDAYLAEFPGVHNAYIAGYWGYLELQKLAGQAEDSTKRATLNRLLSLRVSAFNKDVPSAWFQIAEPVWDSKPYCRSFSVSRNFLYMTPELADYLRANALSKVQTAINEYAYVAPYWFAVKSDTAFGEGVTDNFYNRYTIFQARARILNQSYTQLYSYLDVPAVPVGDLYYIQNLVALIEKGQ